MSYVYMKVLESAPERYDRGMRLLTLGPAGARAPRHRGAAEAPATGCWTWAVAPGRWPCYWPGRDVHVTGIDISPAMLGQAAQRLREEGLAEQVTLRELGVVDLDTAFPDAALTLWSARWSLASCRTTRSTTRWPSAGASCGPAANCSSPTRCCPTRCWGGSRPFCSGCPLPWLAFVLTQNTTHRVAGLGTRIEQAGFRIGCCPEQVEGLSWPGHCSSLSQRRQGKACLIG